MEPEDRIQAFDRKDFKDETQNMNKNITSSMSMNPSQAAGSNTYTTAYCGSDFLSPEDQNAQLFDSSSELCWSGLDGKGFSELMDMDPSFDPSYMAFSQCLQTENADLSRTLPSNQCFQYGFGLPQELGSEAVQQSLELSSPPTLESCAGQQSGEVPTVPATPASSISSSSTEATEDPPAVASTSSSKACSGSCDQEPQEKPSADSNKKPNKPRKKGQKRNREPRFAFMTKSDVDHLEDGYRWRKYGQKAVKNSPYPRSYYRCTNTKCSVKKRVERSFEDPSVVITTYEGQHTHQSPALLRSSASALSASTDEGTLQGLSTTHQPPLNFGLHMLPQISHSLSSFQQSIPQQQERQPIPPAHPALLQNSQAAVTTQATDHGLLEDIVPSVMRNIS